MTVPRPLAIDATAAIRAFCAQQREWLELELQSEQDETALGNRKGSSNNSNSNSNSELTASVLSNLQVAEVSVGLYGRTVVRLESAADATSNGNVGDSSSIPLLPAHRLTTGDEVEFRSKSGSKKSSGSASSAPTGVVSQVTETSISVALSSHKQRSDRNTKKGKEDDNNNDDSNNNDDEMLGIPPPFSLIPKSSAQVHRKMMIALEMLERHGVDHPVSGRVVQALFDPQQQREQQRPSSQQLLPLQNSMLDDSQLEAIQFSLAVDRPVSLIHGPPGTGKTTTVVSLIQYAVHTLHWRVLVVAPSNVAVDNVLERLVVPPREQRLAAGSTLRNSSSSKHGSSKNGSAVQASSRIRAIRLGHPARLQASILPYSLEALVQAADGTEIVADVRQELQAYLAVLAKPRSRGKDKRVAYQEMKVLRKEIRTREEKVVSELLQSAQVVLATCVGADNRLLRNEAFDLVVIDEAAQALEAACWIPVLKAKKVVLAGDHCQLPPTVKSNMPKVQKGLSQTMFERVMDLYRDSSGSGVGSVSRMLKVQYRMHKSIADWASQALYNCELQTHASVESRTLAQLTGRAVIEEEPDSVSKTALLLVDTAGCSLFESVNPAGSRFNLGEAEIVARHVRTLLDLGVEQTQIAIISPYNGQVEVLRSMLLPGAPKLEIRSVDGFQGGEREAVILSLVRSSDRGGMNGIGFLRDNRRLNVAVTRAKRHCCVICDSETVSQSSFIKNLIEWIEEHGEAWSALEFLPESSDGQVESDLLQAERELERLMQESTKAPPRKQVNEARSGKTTRSDQNSKDDPQRKALLNRITGFVKTGKAGDSMALGAKLTKFDRKAVHELAEQLGISHQSEGTEGVDRRITLGIPLDSTSGPSSIKATPLEISVAPDNATNELEAEAKDASSREATSVPSSSAALQVSEPGDNSDDGKDEKILNESALPPPVEPASNNLLGNLAKERAARQKQALQTPAASKKSKSKKKTAQKVGGSKKQAALPKDDSLGDLDDMAFLDAQIDKVQNSHGRTVKGKGSYRTVINGILIAKPAPQEKIKNTKASASLQAKLKEAEGDRKTKMKK